MIYVCIFLTSILSLEIYIKKYYSDKKVNYLNLFFYYTKCVILNFLIINTILLFKLNSNTINITVSFIEKYLILSIAISIIIPFVLNFITKNIRLRINKLISKIKKNKKYKYLNSKVKQFKKYYKNNKKEINAKIIFVIIIALQFWLFDLIIRYYIYKSIQFYEIFKLCPNLLTLLYGLFIGTLLVILPKKISKILYIVIYLINLLIFIVNYMLLMIKSEVFTASDLEIASEGFDYLNFVIKQINIKFIIFIIISIIIFVIGLKWYKKIINNLTLKKRIILIIISIIIFIILKLIPTNFIEDYDSDGYGDLLYPKYYITNFVNSRKNASVLGIYEYMIKSSINYIESKYEKYGSIEEIEELISEVNVTKEDNDKTGIFEGKNLIMIMMESIDNVVVDEETMPTLKMMKENGWNFTKRYSQLNSGGSTIATEYTTQTGLYYTHSINDASNINYSYSIASTFAQNNYIVSSAHENNGSYYNRTVLHKAYGFQNSYFLNDMNLDNLKSYTDAQFAENDEIYDLIVPKNTEEPFMSFIVTISAHGPYSNNDICTSAGIDSNDENTCLRYLSSRTDDLLKSLLERLKEDDLLDDTVIILYSDHSAYSYSYTEDDLSKYEKIDDNYSIKNLPFIIYSEGKEAQTFDDIIVNDIDFVPTILNLFGFDYEPEYYVGTDIFSSNHKNIAIFSDYSWYDGKIYSNNITNKNDDYEEKSKYVKNRIDLSNMIISNDYYKYLRYKKK